MWVVAMFVLSMVSHGPGYIPCTAVASVTDYANCEITVYYRCVHTDGTRVLITTTGPGC